MTEQDKEEVVEEIKTRAGKAFEYGYDTVVIPVRTVEQILTKAALPQRNDSGLVVEQPDESSDMGGFEVWANAQGYDLTMGRCYEDERAYYAYEGWKAAREKYSNSRWEQAGEIFRELQAASGAGVDMFALHQTYMHSPAMLSWFTRTFSAMVTEKDGYLKLGVPVREIGALAFEYLPGDEPTKLTDALEILERVEQRLQRERHDSYEAVHKVAAILRRAFATTQIEDGASS